MQLAIYLDQERTQHRGEARLTHSWEQWCVTINLVNCCRFNEERAAFVCIIPMSANPGALWDTRKLDTDAMSRVQMTQRWKITVGRREKEKWGLKKCVLWFQHTIKRWLSDLVFELETLCGLEFVHKVLFTVLKEYVFYGFNTQVTKWVSYCVFKFETLCGLDTSTQC